MTTKKLPLITPLLIAAIGSLIVIAMSLVLTTDFETAAELAVTMHAGTAQ